MRPRHRRFALDEKRNQPVSVATAQNSGMATEGGIARSSASAICRIKAPVASARTSLNSIAPKSSPLA